MSVMAVLWFKVWPGCHLLFREFFFCSAFQLFRLFVFLLKHRGIKRHWCSETSVRGRRAGSLSSSAAGGLSFYCDLSLQQIKGPANNAIQCSITYRFYFCGGGPDPVFFFSVSYKPLDYNPVSSPSVVHWDIVVISRKIQWEDLNLQSEAQTHFSFLPFDLSPPLATRKRIASEEIW